MISTEFIYYGSHLNARKVYPTKIMCYTVNRKFSKCVAGLGRQCWLLGIDSIDKENVL